MEKVKSTIAKKTEGYGYKYTELADINKYCEDNEIKYYQEVETNEINQKDYIITYVKEKDQDYIKHRGCQIVQATLQGIKNPVQEYGSSLTYCRRYSLLMALGLATEDDDGASLTQKENKEPTIEELEERTDLIVKMHQLELKTDTDHEKILEHFKVETENILTNIQINEAIKILEKKEERMLLEKAINEE